MFDVRTFSGVQIAAHLDAVANLRITVFRDWPYLYAGDREYDKKYLATYAQSPGSLFVLAFDGEQVIGASTGIPLADETAAFQLPFLQQQIRLANVFYFGESVLLADYRGYGLGHRFFDERERYARNVGGFTMTAFCSLERDNNDPRRGDGTRSNDLFWIKRGYRRQHDMMCSLDWQEVGCQEISAHSLSFWLRALEPAKAAGLPPRNMQSVRSTFSRCSHRD
ncbi:MAG: GNAT family N-acetyltransferase [Dokdonella sp.]